MTAAVDANTAAITQLDATVAAALAAGIGSAPANQDVVAAAAQLPIATQAILDASAKLAAATPVVAAAPSALFSDATTGPR